MYFLKKSFPKEAKTSKLKPKNKKNRIMDLDSQIALTFFKMNKEKFNPLKQIKPQPAPKLEDNSTLKGLISVFFILFFQSLNS